MVQLSQKVRMQSTQSRQGSRTWTIPVVLSEAKDPAVG